MTDNGNLPQDINDLLPARLRHIRRQPGLASSAEHHILLESLISLTAPTPNFFLLSILSALTIGMSLFLNQPALLILGIVLGPFFVPIFGSALIPIHLKPAPGFKAVTSIAVHLGLTFTAGAMAGIAQKAGNIDQLGLARFGNLYWLDFIILAFSCILIAFSIIRKGELPRLIGVLLSYEILAPTALAGYALSIEIQDFWPGVLLVSLAHLGVAILFSLTTYLILGFPPRKGLGWLFTLIFLILTALTLVFSIQINQRLTVNPTPLPSATTQVNSITATQSEGLSQTPSNTASPRALSTRTQTPEPSPSSTQTSVPSPTRLTGLVASVLGVVIRESPDFQGEVIDYVNDGEAIKILEKFTTENGTSWYKVIARDEQTGWILAEWVTIPGLTPTNTP